MKNLLGYLILVMCLILCGAFVVFAQMEVQRVLPLPQEFAAYRSWRPLLNPPQEVPLELWMRCVAPSEQDWAEARKTHGPHTKKVIQVYANNNAHKILKKSPRKPFPTGAIIAKEKLTHGGSGAPSFNGVAFMVKRSAGQFQESDGWEFRYFPSSESERAETHAACAACHKTAASKDYVFGDYPGKK